MKFKLKQEKLEELLEKMLVVDIFPSSVFSIRKDGKTGKPVIFSIQRDVHGRAMRYMKVKDTFFDEIDDVDKQESIEIDVNRVMNSIKKIRPGTLLTVETAGNKLQISGKYEKTDDDGKVTRAKNLSVNITFKEPETIETNLPFEFKNGVPVVGKKEVALDVTLNINNEDFKDLTEYASTVKTDFYMFSVTKESPLNVRVGNLHDFSDYWTYEPDYNLESGEELSVILSFGIPQISKTFRHDVSMRAFTDAPAWIYEHTDDYTLGILIPPYIPTEEETF